MLSQSYLLFEHACGYALFRAGEPGSSLKEIVEQCSKNKSFEKLNSLVPLHTYWLFDRPNQALENLNSLTLPELPEDLVNFLKKNLLSKKALKKSGPGPIPLGVGHRSLAEVIMAPESPLYNCFDCLCGGEVDMLLRFVRDNFIKLVPGLSYSSENQLHAALALAYSRGQVKFNAHRADTMIIQCINFVDTLDKDINLYLMRVREWFSYTFPELVRIVPDTTQYLKVVQLIGEREGATEDKIPQLEEILMDSGKAEAIVKAASSSMGMDVTESDNLHIVEFTNHALKLLEDRAQSLQYLREKLSVVAPNLETVVGPHVAARLISHAGGLTNLAKFPASTIQILGAEKALFRAIKTRGLTPKYGLIYNCSQISQASKNDKGRVSRILAAKCGMAARIDCFEEVPNNIYGRHMRQYVEECLRAFKTGEEPPRTADAMAGAVKEARQWLATHSADDEPAANGTTKKRKHADVKQETEPMEVDEEPVRKKKKKKHMKEEPVDEVPVEDTAQIEQEEEPTRKKKKKSKEKNGDSAMSFVETASSTAHKLLSKLTKKEKTRCDSPEDLMVEATTTDMVDPVKKKKKKKKHDS